MSKMRDARIKRLREEEKAWEEYVARGSKEIYKNIESEKNIKKEKKNVGERKG